MSFQKPKFLSPALHGAILSGIAVILFCETAAQANTFEENWSSQKRGDTLAQLQNWRKSGKAPDETGVIIEENGRKLLRIMRPVGDGVELGIVSNESFDPSKVLDIRLEAAFGPHPSKPGSTELPRVNVRVYAGSGKSYQIGIHRHGASLIRIDPDNPNPNLQAANPDVTTLFKSREKMDYGTEAPMKFRILLKHEARGLVFELYSGQNEAPDMFFMDKTPTDLGESAFVAIRLINAGVLKLGAISIQDKEADVPM